MNSEKLDKNELKFIKKINEDYLLYFLNNEKSNTQKDIFITFGDIYNKITNNFNHDNNDLTK